jgi:hypothetical protein
MKNHEFLAAVTHEFELSFLATGLTPVNRRFGDGQGEGCLVTALDVSEHGNHVPGSFSESLVHDISRVERVRDHLHARFTAADADWWGTFVRYLILGFDHFATCPRQWMKRTCDEEFTGEGISPKLMGAAVGGILRYRLLLARPIHEKSPTPLPRARQQTPLRREVREAVTV